MELTKYKQKRFLFPILSLVLISIVLIATISSYLTINMFKIHMEEHIEEVKKDYSLKNKTEVYENVHFVDDLIKFQIISIEDKLKASLKEKVKVALDIATFTYNKYKNTHSKEEIKNEISKILSVIKFNENRAYYFMYDNKTKVIFGHPLKKFLGKDMTNFKDAKGRSLMETDAKALENKKIGFNKIFFTKPDGKKDQFPKITCIAKFEELDLIFGIGEYLDVIENEIKDYVIKRFSSTNDITENEYLFILNLHDINGGDEYATLLLNPNKPNLIGKKVSDKLKDVNGKEFVKEILNKLKEKGEGYYEYWYKKPSENIAKLKLSYIYLQKDWNWIIGSGFYYEDLEEKIFNMKESVTLHTNETINKTIIWVCILSFLAILIAIYVSYIIDKTIKKYTNTIINYKDKKRKQEQLLIHQSKMAAMGEMLGNIAHQWRQPLSIISTSATGCKLQNEAGLSNINNINEHFERINETTQYLSETINDFTSFFNSSNTSVSKFNISDTFDKTLNIIKSQFTEKDIEIIQDINYIELLSMENEIIQVLINILNNSRDALMKLENQRRLIFINIYKKNKKLIIEIKDNAKGIPENIIDRIFEPYFTTKHRSQGTGIGLYMSQEIIKTHLNGVISVENETYEYENVKYTGAKFIIKIAL